VSQLVSGKFVAALLSSVFTLAMMVAAPAFAASQYEAEVVERIKPAGTVCVEGDDCGGAAPAPVASGPRSGKEVYDASCGACHASGVMNAPKFGDAASWSARLGNGVDGLIKNAIGGTAGGMPPKGGCGNCSDEEIGAAVNYMLDNSK